MELTQTLDIFGVTEKKGVPITSSRNIAEIFSKRHDDVLRTIENTIKGLRKIAESSDTNPDLIRIVDTNPEMYFISSRYKNNQKKWQPEYLLTRKGFDLIALGFTGNKALQYKVAYIRRFDEMKEFIETLNAMRLEHPAFTEAIMNSHESPKPYHFSNESDMINRIVLGETAKEFKLRIGLGDIPSIRPYLTAEQIKSIDRLQKHDIGLMMVEPDYQKRKEALIHLFNRLEEIRLKGERNVQTSA
jgi:Rha family phage regulatory protein